jgi:hypothetical protein
MSIGYYGLSDIYGNIAESTIISSRGNQLDLSTWMAMSRLFGTAPDHSLLDVVHLIFVKT